MRISNLLLRRYIKVACFRGCVRRCFRKLWVGIAILWSLEQDAFFIRRSDDMLPSYRLTSFQSFLCRLSGDYFMRRNEFLLSNQPLSRLLITLRKNKIQSPLSCLASSTLLSLGNPLPIQTIGTESSRATSNQNISEAALSLLILVPDNCIYFLRRLP